MAYPNDYDPEKGTVQEYVHRELERRMSEEADRWAASVLYGDRSGGPPKGLIDG